jgi:hypothetical protein
MLYITEDTGRPDADDHQPGCECLERAVQVMRYAIELQRAASEPLRGASRADRRRQHYLQKSAKELSAAACADNPVLALNRLAKKYAGDSKSKTIEAEAAEMVREACQALARGDAPALIAQVSNGGGS